MTPDHDAEIQANLQRADEALGAAQALLGSRYYDSVASRAYYAAFYAATALLLSEGLEFSKHSAVIALVHQKLVKSGNLPVEQGKDLGWLFQLRTIGDYGGTAHVTGQDAVRAVTAAESFIQAAKSLLRNE
jgi:uncharacterized protein (UPF0332 family)